MSDFRARDSWKKRHFTRGLEAAGEEVAAAASVAWSSTGSGSGLEVLENHDPVTLNGRGPHPLRIGSHEYRRGLYCHAPSRVIVRLPAAGRRFWALAGLDHNEDTARGKGSVVFRVRVGGRLAYESEVVRYGTPAQPVRVDLEGERSFALEIGDAGDGIGWDQSDWAEARVELADGRELWLGDLPVQDGRQEQGLAAQVRSIPLAFSFLYGGRSSDQLLPRWTHQSRSERLDTHRRRSVWTWTEPGPGLQVECVMVEYVDFPALEWTVFLRNAGNAPLPLVENLQGLDACWWGGGDGPFVLNGCKGDWCAPQGYEPYRIDLPSGEPVRFAPDGGRPTNGPRGWPYFNVQSARGGVLLAVGWPGQWSATFLHQAGEGVRVVAGQQMTRIALKPAETIRTPLTAALFWEGDDVVRSQNLWRRWFLAHVMPRRAGELPQPMLQMQCYRTFEKGGEADLFETVREYRQAGIDFDLCWRDAGWYPCKGSWPNTGTWEPDPVRYPRGFRPFSDWLHGQGKQFIVWFEPERVGDPGSWLAATHPEWLLGGGLLNLGNPEARHWLVEHVDGLLKAQGIDHYRQDFNLDPLPHWRAQDSPDRRGMTENLYVAGYLAYWDELRRRNPRMLIDSCASGGRRNDLETLRRALPLLRSDYQFGHEATTPNQGHTYGISSWIPYYGSGCYFTDPYSARSYIMPCSGYGGTNAETRRAYAECRRVQPFMLGDFYPLTAYSLGPENWMAWQFDRPELQGGVIQAFRREACTRSNLVVRLRGLVPGARYLVTDLDLGILGSKRGRELMEQGLTIEAAFKPAAVVVFYQRE